jgi:predicted PhzF superfamily epimerase YddE/YHI9
VLAFWNKASTIRAIKLGHVEPLLREAGTYGLITTAGGTTASPYDFISRFFAPEAGVPEDPVTGSAHCVLAPFWAKRLGKRELKARQVSARGGDLLCTDEGDRVTLSGPCALYMRGEIEI